MFTTSQVIGALALALFVIFGLWLYNKVKERSSQKKRQLNENNSEKLNEAIKHEQDRQRLVRSREKKMKKVDSGDSDLVTSAVIYHTANSSDDESSRQNTRQEESYTPSEPASGGGDNGTNSD